MELRSNRILLMHLEEFDLKFIYELSRNSLVYKYEEDTEPTKEHIFTKYIGKIRKWNMSVESILLY